MAQFITEINFSYGHMQLYSTLMHTLQALRLQNATGGMDFSRAGFRGLLALIVTVERQRELARQARESSK